MAGNSIFCTAKNPVTLGITKLVITPKTTNMTIIPNAGPISALNVFLLISRFHLISFMILANASIRLPVFSPIDIKPIYIALNLSGYLANVCEKRLPFLIDSLTSCIKSLMADDSVVSFKSLTESKIETPDFLIVQDEQRLKLSLFH